ncbi:hypothetical protein RchiOBHm_Chr2g0111831 [Rosa chinensis]|uniref:Uncharacterized protein n=1 Tax=Rosa chinensis TaxID=74649 RepID=A0A2P6RQ57_ROSCH|nr:UPF0481 protein At3g47200 [Rosa chinensis]PRQ48540.1 hypothetical protein RchiOBHm_Chr2g0111831 [Rosa chinensis]
MANDGSRTIDVEALEKSIDEKLRSDSPLSAKCCIFKVPEVLRRHKPEAYQPDVVSIGPFHHQSGKKFEHMENVKHWYLKNLLSRLGVSLKTLIERIDVVEFGREARGLYADPLNELNQNDFIEMMILDGCFLLELFWRCQINNLKLFLTTIEDVNAEVELGIGMQQVDAWNQILDIDNDSIFNMHCMVQYLCHDLLLLENQLPWFVLERLYSLTIGLGKPNPQTSLIHLVLSFFSTVSSLAQHCACYSSCSQNNILHILDLIRRTIVDPFEECKSSTNTETNLLSATILSEAGVEFKQGSIDGNIMNIDFKNGVLTIPKLAIAELTEPLFRNLIAFEQCYHHCEHKVTSYALLMSNLIASSKDAHFLRKKEILSNWLSAEDAFSFFDKLYSDTLLRDFCYGGLCAEVNEYHKHRRNKWRAKLKRDHCSNPWKIISLVAAFILLVLTTLQTAFTIQQYYFPR